MGDHYILEGHTPIIATSLEEWSRWYRGADRQVARYKTDDVTVSTIFLGLDHSFRGIRGGGPPILFETMVFGGPLNHEQERYETWEQAEKGHARWVSRVEEAEAP